MSVLLFLLACVAALMSVVFFAVAASAIHEILAAVVGLAAAILLGCACIVAAVDGLKKRDDDGPAPLNLNPPAKCPFCAEDIKREANVCKYCGRDLPAKEAA